jgi:Mesyanzhinovviridae DNA helicase
MSYQPKTDHLKHQAKLFAEHAEQAVLAVFNEQGTGKSKSYIDMVAHAYEQKRINALLLVAPKGVERNFAIKELPKHWPDRLQREVFIYQTKQAKNKRSSLDVSGFARNGGEEDREFIMKYDGGIPIVCISYSALVTDLGKAFAKRFLQKHKAAYILDESHFIKSPSAVRTKTIVASGAYAEFKRIGTGTPMGAEGPLDLYSQIRFLDPEFWKLRNIPDFACYKAFVGDWVRIDNWDKLLRWKNLDKINEWLQEISVRVLKADVLPDLPAKLHTRHFIELPAEHRRVYSQVKDDLRAELMSGVEMDIKNRLVVLRKLLQVASGYIKDTTTGLTHPINDDLPRIDACEDWCDASNTQGIIWTRFRHDADLLVKRLGLERVARYDGAVDDEQRAINLEAFERGDKQFFLANPRVGGTGLTLTQASRQWHHGVDVDPVALKQAQDRSHRPGQHNAVLYTYCVAQDTVDEQVIDTLLANEDVSRTILGDKFSELL